MLEFFVVVLVLVITSILIEAMFLIADVIKLEYGNKKTIFIYIIGSIIILMYIYSSFIPFLLPIGG